MSTSIAAIGLGGLGRVLLRTVSGLDDATVAAGVDVSPDARDRFQRDHDAPSYADIDSLLANEDVDAAMIATPHALHYEQAMECLEADLDVFVEKPMVTDVADAVDLVETAKERDRALAVGYQRRFHPAFVEIERIVESGRIGRIHAANAHLSQDWIDIQRGTWRTDPSLSGGGQLYDSGSHLLDALLWTTDTSPRSVAAQLTFAEPGVDTDAALALTLERDDRPVTASVTVSGDGVDGEPAEGYVILGADGRLEYDGERIRVTERGAATYETEITADADFSTLTERKLRNFLEGIRGSGIAVSGEVGLEITALTEAAYRAAEEGRTIDVRKMLNTARKARGRTPAD